PPDVASPVSLEVEPKQFILESAGARQQLTARAKYSDGAQRDVTNLAVFLTSNDNSAGVSCEGLVTSKNRGEAFVMARFATFTVGCQVVVTPKGLNYQWSNAPENNYIDTLIEIGRAHV